MAIYFNDLILEPKEGGTSLQKLYFDGLQEVKALFEKFRKKGSKNSYIVFTRDFPKKFNVKKTSYKPAPPIAIPMSANIYDPVLGSVQIRYSPSPPARSGNKLVWPRVEDNLVFETLTIPDTKLDFAWFMLKASTFVKNGILKIVDERQQYIGEFAKVQKEMDAARCIFGTEVTYDDLETIATILFPGGEVQGNADKDKEFLATRIWDFVKKGEENRKPYNFESLMAASSKIKKARVEIIKQQTDESNSPVVTIELKTGESIQVPLLKCPPSMSKEKLSNKAKELEIPFDESMDKDTSYSIIKYYLSLQPA